MMENDADRMRSLHEWLGQAQWEARYSSKSWISAAYW